MNNITKKTTELVNTLNSYEKCNIEISKDSRNIVRIEKDNKLRYLGSKYSIERDIHIFLDDIGKIDNNTILIVFGVGAGEHIKCLLSNLSETNKVFIVEPSANVIKEVLKLSYCMDILSDNRVALCYLDDSIKKHMNNFIDDYNIDNAKVVAFSNYPAIFENEYKIIIDAFASVKNLKKLGNETLNVFSQLFFNNFIENIFTLEEFYTVNYLKDLYKDKPAVIVSSGPSLTKNVHLLKEAQDKLVIISGPRTIGTLIENDIKPDFVCAVDPQDKTYTLMKEYINSKIPLVFMDSTDNKIVKEHKGLKIIAANQGMENHLQDILGTKMDSLMQGGSVAHFCMGLAVYLGCKTIIFIGQDLAYTDDKFQAEGTYAGEMDELKYRYENDKEKWDEDKSYNIYVNDIYENKIRTSSVLNSYREEFEELINDCAGIKFINSTEGGANIKGTEVMPLKRSIDLYGVKNINKNLDELLPEPIVINEDDFIEKMLQIVNKLESIKEACEQGLEYSDQMLYFYKDNRPCDLNKVFMELDRVDAILNNKEELGLLAYRLISAMNSVMDNDYYKDKKDETEKELGNKLAKRSFAIYLTVLQVVEEMIFMIKDKFIYINFRDAESNLSCDKRETVFLKRNLNKNINELKKKYSNLREINYEKDIDWEKVKKQRVHIEIKNNNELILYHKNKVNMDFNEMDVLFGNKELNGDKLNLYTERIANFYGRDNNLNYLSVYNKQKNNYESLLLDIELNNNDGHSYFSFFSNDMIDNINSLSFNKYDLVNKSMFQIYIIDRNIGYHINRNGIVINEVFSKVETNNIKVFINIKEEYISINNVNLSLSKFFLKNYFKESNFMVTVSSVESNFNFKINKVETGYQINSIPLDLFNNKPIFIFSSYNNIDLDNKGNIEKHNVSCGFRVFYV